MKHLLFILLLAFASSVFAGPTPEIAIDALSGKVQVKKDGGSWVTLSAKDTFEINDHPSFRTNDTSEVTLRFPGNSTLTVLPQSQVFLSENERREFSILYGAVSVQGDSKAKDKAGLQLRSVGGVVLCEPSASLVMGVSALGEAFIYLEKGAASFSNEREALKKLQANYQERYEAKIAGKEVPEKMKQESTKLEEGKAASFFFLDPTPKTLAETYESTKAIQEAIKIDEASWNKELPSRLPPQMKVLKADLIEIDANLAFIEASSKTIVSIVEELKAARASKDEEKIDKVEGIAREYSLMIITAKRRTHLLVLETKLQLDALDFIAERASKGDAKKVLESEKKTIKGLKSSTNKALNVVKDFRPRVTSGPMIIKYSNTAP